MPCLNLRDSATSIKKKDLEIKYKELISYHYSFKDTAPRLSNQRGATSGSSDSPSDDPAFGVGQIPLDANKTSEAQKDQEPF